MSKELYLKKLILITLFFYLSVLLIVNVQADDLFKKRYHKFKITDKQELKKFISFIVMEDSEKNYTQFTREEQIFYDDFITRMVDSYKENDYSLENIKKHLTPENIEKQKEEAFRDYIFDREYVEKENEEQIKINSPTYDEFFDKDLDDENSDEKPKDDDNDNIDL